MSVKAPLSFRLAFTLIVNSLLLQTLVSIAQSFTASYHNPEFTQIMPVQLKIEQGSNNLNEWSSFTIIPKFMNNSVTSDYQNNYTLLETLIIPEAIKRISRMLVAKGQGMIPISSETHCDKIHQLTEKSSIEKADAHLFAYFLIGAYNSTWLTSGTTCAVSDSDNRPVVALIKLNIEVVSWGLREIEELVKEVMGQFFHVIAFSTKLMNLYPTGFSSMFQFKNDTSYNSTSIGHYEIVSEEVLGRARRYFNCPSMTGLPMRRSTEHDTSLHFSQFLMVDEMMTGEDFGYKVISEFTLAFLVDSGWYKADFSYAEQLTFGKDAGCELIDSVASNKTFTNSCDLLGVSYCSNDFASKSLCMQASNFETNFIPKPVRGGHCVFDRSLVRGVPFESNSTNSRCFSVIGYGQQNTGCFESYCVDGVLNVTVNAVNYTCVNASQTIYFSNLIIICPDPAEFCKFKQACSGCSGNGVCLTNGKCRCNVMYEGDQCERRSQCDLKIPNICDNITDYGMYLTYEIVYKSVTVQATFLGLIAFLFFN